MSHSQPHGLGTALFIDFKAAAPTTGLPPPSLAAPRSCLVLSNLNCEPSVTDTASWKGREAVLFIIRRSWPSEHGHFFQAACQSPHSPGSIYGPPTGPCGHRIASKGTEAAWPVRTHPQSGGRGPVCSSRACTRGHRRPRQPGLPLLPPRGVVRDRGESNKDPQGPSLTKLESSRFSPQGLNKNGEEKMYSCYET